MSLKLPTPPTPPTIDKGELADTAPKIDAHKFFQVPFERKAESENLAQDEKPLAKSEPQIVERHSPTPEELAREAVAKGAGILTKKDINRPENAQAPSANPISNPVNDNPKEILREFQKENTQLNTQISDNPRPIKLKSHENHGGVYWIITLILVIVASFIFVKKFLISDNPALKKSDLFEGSGERLKATADKVSKPAKKNDDKGKHFEIRV